MKPSGYDEQTYEFYRFNAESYCSAGAPALSVPCSILMRYADHGSSVLDYGCGCGHDLHFLKSKGFKVTGYEPVKELAMQAVSIYPELKGIIKENADDTQPFDSVLCSAVLQHIADGDLFSTAHQLKKLTDKILVISVPFAASGEFRDDNQRLFRIRPAFEYRILFERLGFEIVCTEESEDSLGRKDRKWITLVFRKNSEKSLRPIERIERIINKDVKNTTYKLALLRSFADIASNYYNSVKIIQEDVNSPAFAEIPLSLITDLWIRYYWPFIADGSNIRMGVNKNDQKDDMKFRKDLSKITEKYRHSGGYPVYLKDSYEVRKTLNAGRQKRESDEIQQLINSLHRNVQSAIISGPVQYTKDESGKPCFSKRNEFLRIPADIWEEFIKMSYWIRDSVLLRWADLILLLNRKTPEVTKEQILRIVSEELLPERDVLAARRIYADYMAEGKNIDCVWSGKPLNKREFEVDHAIPFSLWRNNDLWNLLPADKDVNGNKSDQLPEHELILKQKDSIIFSWKILYEKSGERFLGEASDLAGKKLRSDNWEYPLFHAFTEAVEFTAWQRKAERWSPRKNSI